MKTVRDRIPAPRATIFKGQIVLLEPEFGARAGP